MGSNTSTCGREVGAACRAARGFTILELLLAMALVLVLMGIIVMNVVGWRQSMSLEDATSRMDSTLRMARAEAANLGKRLRLDFHADGQMGVTWEPQPLVAPGAFVPYESVAWVEAIPNDQVRIVRCDLIGPSAAGLTEQPAGQARASASEAPRQTVTFFPDGTSDSAIIEMMEAQRDGQHVIVEIEGLTGVISSRLIAPSDLDEYHQQLSQRLEGAQ